MKKAWKPVVITVAAAVFLTAAAYCVLRFGFGKDVLDRSGWSLENGKTRYLDYYGRPLTGLQPIDGGVYYFSSGEGAMHTGWLGMDGKDYYFGTDGRRQSGWVDAPEGRFYLGIDGAAVYGWYGDDQGLRYLKQGTGLVTGWLDLGENRYFFDAQGLAVTGWQEIEGKRYFFDGKGAMVTGWLEQDGSRYCLGGDGVVLTGWQDDNGFRRLFDESGAMVTGWHETEQGLVFFGDDGLLLLDWQEIEGKRYYFGEEGLMHTGWLELDGERYYLREDGTMAVGEVVIDGVSRFFTSKGKYVVMVNPWYFVPADYELNMGWIEGYQFDLSGIDALAQMLADCRAAGYGCTINNTYRSQELQRYMWNVRIDQRMAEGMTYSEAITYIGMSLAKVGASEHHLGLAVDLDGSSAMEAWMAEHCWDYGFIVRYPDGKTDVTGIIYEPWHFRYVGLELAQELKELGLCMEEYMAMLTESSV